AGADRARRRHAQPRAHAGIGRALRLRDRLPGARQGRLRQHEAAVPGLRRALRVLPVEGRVSECADLSGLRDAGKLRFARSLTMSESPEQMHARLCGVIAAAQFELLSEPHAWTRLGEPWRPPADALAVVRDGAAWYALRPVPQNSVGAYRIVVFHFAEG